MQGQRTLLPQLKSIGVILNSCASLKSSAEQGKHVLTCFTSLDPNMSRSRRKTPIRGITSAASERSDKQAWHCSYRTAVRRQLANDPDSELPHPRQFSDPWRMAKDGKSYYGVSRRDEKTLRK